MVTKLYGWEFGLRLVYSVDVGYHRIFVVLSSIVPNENGTVDIGWE
jgi:hypothetical protein